MKADGIRGHLDGLVLAVLEREPCHGYGVVQALRVRSGGSLDLPTGTVYPALYRLERAGFISSSPSTVAGRQRRVYRLSKAGRRALQSERAAWRELSGAVGSVLLGEPA